MFGEIRQLVRGHSGLREDPTTRTKRGDRQAYQYAHDDKRHGRGHPQHHGNAGNVISEHCQRHRAHLQQGMHLLQIAVGP